MKLKEVFEDVFGKDNSIGTLATKVTMSANELAKNQQEFVNAVGRLNKQSKDQDIKEKELKKQEEELNKEKAKFNDMVRQEQIKKAQANAVNQVSTQVDLAMKENK